MSVTTTFLVALGAAAGAPLRVVLARLDGRFPVGMLLVNVLGSGLFGVFAALALDGAAWALLGTGFCGGFTSFSTFAVQSVDRRGRVRVPYVVVTTVLAVAACTAGWSLGTALG